MALVSASATSRSGKRAITSSTGTSAVRLVPRAPTDFFPAAVRANHLGEPWQNDHSKGVTLILAAEPAYNWVARRRCHDCGHNYHDEAEYHLANYECVFYFLGAISTNPYVGLITIQISVKPSLSCSRPRSSTSRHPFSLASSSASMPINSLPSLSMQRSRLPPSWCYPSTRSLSTDERKGDSRGEAQAKDLVPLLLLESQAEYVVLHT